ncbi:MAG TPA: Calx-beta domain-containing protein [Pyrinomonadaceae bacterium]
MKKLLAGRSLKPLKRRLRPTAAALFALLLTFTTLTTPVGAAADLDPTFGTNGLVMSDFGAFETADTAAVQTDGKIVVAGIEAEVASPSLAGDIRVVRYGADGSLDNAFGSGGRVLLDFGDTADSPSGVLVQSDGKIVLVGESVRFGDNIFETVTDFVLARFNPDGSPDNTFGAGGRATTRFPRTGRADARGATAQPDGKLILIGYVEVLPRPQANIYDIAIARYGPTPSAEPTSFARFSSQTYGASEGCAATTVTVTREGDLSAPASVEYRTRDISARQLSDYTHVTGTLNFATGESSKSFAVPVNDDAYAEVTETIGVELVGGSSNINFRVPASATLNVADDDAVDGGTNPLDESRNFVCQHYHDFLSRQPDAAGLDFWTRGIEDCGADAGCREVKRIDVSTAFFLSIEFQNSGYFVIRAHKAGLGNNKQTPRYMDFLRDTQRVAEGVVVGTPGADARLEANRQAFAAAFVARPEFVAAPSSRATRSIAVSTTRASSSRNTSATCAATRTGSPTSTSRATTSGSPSSTASASPTRTCATSAWRWRASGGPRWSKPSSSPLNTAAASGSLESWNDCPLAFVAAGL